MNLHSELSEFLRECHVCFDNSDKVWDWKTIKHYLKLAYQIGINSGPYGVDECQEDREIEIEKRERAAYLEGKDDGYLECERELK